MSRGAQRQLTKSRSLIKPTEYVSALLGECSAWAYDEERVLELKGQWREKVFEVDQDQALDLEIGTGNGIHFSHRALSEPNRLLVGLELKYKPLIQAIRRTIREGANNARVARYNAVFLDDIFKEDELNDVFIHFPDPWSKTDQRKHRLIQDHFLERLFVLQRPGSSVYFKTDDRDYFDWSLEKFENSSYQIVDRTFDLHRSQFAGTNFITHFESLFLKQGLPIHYLKASKGAVAAAQPK